MQFMYGFLVLLHVLTVVFVVGPAALAPWDGVRGLARRDADEIHTAGRRSMMFNAATAVVFASGLAAVTASDEHSVTAPWIVISITLYVVALTLGVGVVPATLSRIAKKVKIAAADVAAAAPEVDAIVQRNRGRLGAMAALTGVLYAVIVMLMVLRPFS